MAGKCYRSDECDLLKYKGSSGCEGCGFKHFDNIFRANPDNKSLGYLWAEFFNICSTGERSIGGRKNLDVPLKNLIKRSLPKDTKEIKAEAKWLTIDGEEILFKPKFDAAFEIRDKFLFFEVKGYGDNTNDVLSAITAAQLLKKLDEYKNCLYYYIGINSSLHSTGLTNDDLHDVKRIKLYPYVTWAEKLGLLKFFGVVNINDLLNELQKTVKGNDSR